jgi:hypothetical protein
VLSAPRQGGSIKPASVQSGNGYGVGPIDVVPESGQPVVAGRTPRAD